MFMFADNIAFIAENECKLQCLVPRPLPDPDFILQLHGCEIKSGWPGDEAILDVLHEWCVKWEVQIHP